ncbi:MAG: zinc ribbon domain-containing protein [Candidatus Helarchaeota archaeon]|nr:zinc ribbon domain-containing protein [Candidatus Helarchaeota archaeon]
MINPYQISQSVKALITQAERGPMQATAPAGAVAVAATGAAAGLGAGVSAPATVGVSGDACPRCRRPIQPNFFFCPYCSLTLREFRCDACQKVIRLDYKMCPYCGSVVSS